MIIAAPLAAQDGQFRFGSQLSFLNPSGDLSDVSKSGFGLALQFERAWTEKMATRARIEYLAFGTKDLTDKDLVEFMEVKAKATVYGISGDWLYSFNSFNQGAFFFAGPGFYNAKIEDSGYIDYSIIGGGVLEGSDSRNKTCFAVLAGVGFNFNRNLGAEVKYTKTFGLKFYDEDEKSVKWDWIQLSASYRF